jgi:hypothetical protein
MASSLVDNMSTDFSPTSSATNTKINCAKLIARSWRRVTRWTPPRPFGEQRGAGRSR